MEKTYKVILLGDAGVGKTSICNRKLYGEFRQEKPTIGIGNSKILIKLDNDNIELSIWDTAGQEEYHSIAPLYIKSALCVIIVASLFDSSSIEHITK